MFYKYLSWFFQPSCSLYIQTHLAWWQAYKISTISPNMIIIIQIFWDDLIVFNTNALCHFISVRNSCTTGLVPTDIHTTAWRINTSSSMSRFIMLILIMRILRRDIYVCPHVWPRVSPYSKRELQDVTVSLCVCVYQPWEACRVSDEILKDCSVLQIRPAGCFLHLQKPPTLLAAALGLPWCQSSLAPERLPSGHSPPTPTLPVRIYLPLFLLPSWIGQHLQTFAMGVTLF